MTDEQNSPEVTPTEPEAPKRKNKPKAKAKATPFRSQSSISFPYMDLDTAVAVAKAILDAGGVPLTRDQLAGAMNQAAGSGNFVTKIATARTFGLVEYNNGKYELTGLGNDILDSDENAQKAARAQAFLTVPLYKRVYEEFRGRQLPPRPNGLEQAMVNFGVAVKQKSNARLAFDKSAAQAGFFGKNNERLVEPILGTGKTDRRPAPQQEPPPEEDQEPRWERRAEPRPVSRPESGPDLHPFIEGLLRTLPAPDTEWPTAGRSKWLETAAHIFDLIYKDVDDDTLTIQLIRGKDAK